MYEIGDKVIPVRKTAGDRNLKDSAAWKNARKKEQPYLYVVKFRGDVVVCDERENGIGDHFHASDLIPYLPDKNEWCVHFEEETREFEWKENHYHTGVAIQLIKYKNHKLDANEGYPYLVCILREEESQHRFYDLEKAMELVETIKDTVVVLK